MNFRNEASETVRRFYAAVDKKPHNRAALSSFFAPEYKDHNRPAAPPNVPDSEVMLALFDQLNRGFPDARHEIVLLEPIGDGRAVVYWKFSGTHAGPFLDRPPSRHRVTIKGVDILQVKNGKFTQHWHVEDLSSLFAQVDGK
jgi:predicted SnoaL-like aldol condensation-catalyzing enzyme